MACGLRSNPKGKLSVKAGVGDSQAKTTVPFFGIHQAAIITPVQASALLEVILVSRY